MKSLAVSVFWPAWHWTKDPAKRWLYASYAQSLSIRDSVKCRRVIDSPWYRSNWAEGFRLTTDQNTKIRFDNDQGGYRIATSVDGALTGEGGDVIVIDDPHNVREGESEAVRESVLSWWDEAMSTRLNDPKTGAYVIIMQRVHARDLVGHILAREHDWEHLCLPARYEADHPHVWARDSRTEGALLWPERFGEGEVSKLETALGSYGSAGQLQQRPAPREGGMFKREWFEIVRAAPAGCTSVRGWDLAATKEKQGIDPAYTAGLKLSRAPDRTFYVEDVRRDRWSAGEVERTLKSVASQDGASVAISIPQDPGQAGKAQVSYLVKALAGYNVRATPESGDKAQRAEPVSAQAEAGNVKLVQGDWNEAFLDEACAFPNGAYLDQVDALSRAFTALTDGPEIPGGIDLGGLGKSSHWRSN